MDKGGISRKRFPDNSEDLRNATGPYSQILRMDKSAKTFLNNEKFSSSKEKFENYRKKTYHF